MANPAVLLSDVAQSNLPLEKKSAIRRFVERTLGADYLGMAQKPALYMRETGHAIRTGGEAVITGGGLGLLSAQRGEAGLDTKYGPIDGWAALLAFAGSVAMAGDMYGISRDLQNVGGQSLSILLFRKAEAWRKKEMGSVPISGERGESVDDAIMVVARDLGL